ncbi:MAG: DUF3784 domain-containing protein [Lachnospiraceae bacterium]|nr:DUF3784 domain-containing protein [Lachnospiraceae bacterium]
MPWCPKCKNEYREGITTCSDCNVPLVEDLSEVVSDDKKLVFTTEHKEKTDDFIKYLAYSGIHSYSVEPDENEFIWSLYVAEDDYKKASKLFTGFALTESEREIEKKLSMQIENDSDDINESDYFSDSDIVGDTDISGNTDIEMTDIPDDIIIPDDTADSEFDSVSDTLNDDNTEEDNNDDNDSDDNYYNNSDDSARDALYSEKQNEEIRKLNARMEFNEMNEAPSATYIRKSDRAKEYRFSAYTCFICGIAGIIFIVLHLLGIINLVAATFSQFVLLIVFAAFLFGGFVMYFNSKTIQSEAGDEENLEKSVIEWLELNVTETYLSDIHDDDTPEEVNYFKYCEVIKGALLKEFPEAPVSMLDALIDEHLSKIC